MTTTIDATNNHINTISKYIKITDTTTLIPQSLPLYSVTSNANSITSGIKVTTTSINNPYTTNSDTTSIPPLLKIPIPHQCKLYTDPPQLCLQCWSIQYGRQDSSRDFFSFFEISAASPAVGVECCGLGKEKKITVSIIFFPKWIGKRLEKKIPKVNWENKIKYFFPKSIA